MRKRNDLTGCKFGRLTVISCNEELTKIKKRAYWNCLCDCGKEKPICGYSLTSGQTTSCGCYNKEIITNDLTGKTFDRLTVIERKGIDKRGYALWLCECDCGNSYITSGKNLTSGHTRSCGCLQKEVVSNQMKELNEILWQDEEFQKMHSEKMKQLRAEWEQDENYKKMRSDIAKKQWQDEEFRNAHSGENHHNYNPNLTQEDRENMRCQEGYNYWVKGVKIKANKTCDCCGFHTDDFGELCSHHLDGYNWCKEHRLDPTNGVCLCESCHKEFHYIYGYGDNTKEQYIKFKQQI